MNFFKISKFFLYLVPFSVVLVTSSTIFPFIVGKYVFFRTAVSLALIFYLSGLLFNKFKIPTCLSGNQNSKSQINLKSKISACSAGSPAYSAGKQNSKFYGNSLVIAVLVFVLIFVLAGFFGVNPSFSFWSNFERGEGGLQILYLGIFFLLLVLLFKENRDWQKLFLISIIAAVLMIFYGIFAGLGYANFFGQNFGDEGFRFSGSIGNPAYAAAYLVFAIFYALYLLIVKYRERLKSAGAIGLMAVIIFFLFFFFLAATRGAFIGVILAALSGLIYLGFSIKAWRKWFLSAGIITILIVGSFIYFRDTPFIKSIPGSRIFDISFQTENFQNRMIIWKIALDGFRERPLLGWGPENFPVIFDKHYNVKHFNPKTEGFGAWYDRAHNIFLEYLTQAGILGLLSFLAIFGAFYFLLFKNKLNPLESALLFVVPVAYLVQGLVLFDILPTYINLFIFLAFATHKFNSFSLKV